MADEPEETRESLRHLITRQNHTDSKKRRRKQIQCLMIKYSLDYMFRGVFDAFTTEPFPQKKKKKNLVSK